jgi:hypothetical protein
MVELPSTRQARLGLAHKNEPIAKQNEHGDLEDNLEN